MEKRQLVPFLEGDLACQFVGARDPDSDGHFGPVAEITHGDDWLHIVTDPSEGNVMLNIEALPKLIEALERIRDASRALRVRPQREEQHDRDDWARGQRDFEGQLPMGEGKQ